MYSQHIYVVKYAQAHYYNPVSWIPAGIQNTPITFPAIFCHVDLLNF